MAKEVAGLIKLQIKGGAANPAPPVGPALGAKGVNIMEFLVLEKAKSNVLGAWLCAQEAEAYHISALFHKDRTAEGNVQGRQGFCRA